MAKAKYDWTEIQKAYECGKTVDELVKKYDVEKKTLQNKISEKKWEVSGKIKADITELKTSIGKISGTLGNNPDKAHIIAEDVIDCINQIADLVEGEKIVKSATLLNLARTVNYLKNNTKLEKVSAGAGIQELVEVGLGSDDFKQCQDAIDKASITLGVNQRHSNSKVNIQNTNAAQTSNNIDIENMDAKQITNAYLDLIKK